MTNTNAAAANSEVCVRLRPFAEPDLAMLGRFASDPAFSTPFEWTGFTAPQSFRRRWEEDTFLASDPHLLAVADADDTLLGWVSWRDPLLFGRPGGSLEIGALLAPENRGRGVGTAAQRMLVEHLFGTKPVHRLCANTESDNAAEQKCLEKCGFRREGLFREVGFRDGQWRDIVVYARLRSD